MTEHRTAEVMVAYHADPQEWIRATVDGVDSHIIQDLADQLRVRPDVIGVKLGISRATMQRRLAHPGPLPLTESDRAVRFIRLWQRAKEVWDSDDATREWLMSPERSLGGSTPFDYAITEIGAQVVDRLLGQIEHGIVS